MLRQWLVFGTALVVLTGAGLAEGGPPENGDPIPEWGRWVDPDGDCVARATKDRLEVEVPATPHDLSNELGLMNAPRVMRTVDRDFIAQVRVAGPLNPQGESTIATRLPFNGAGLFLAGREGDHVRLERGAIFRDGKVLTYVNFEQRDGDQYRNHGGIAVPNRDLYLRLERYADQLFGSVSLDGVRWTPLTPLPLRRDQMFSVGLAAISTSSAPFVARFEEFGIFARLPRFEAEVKEPE